MAEKKMIIDGIECPFTNERNVLEVARKNGIDIPSLCYCENLRLIDCEMIDCDLSFEYSDVDADVTSEITSVKNPKSGKIVADAYGEIILTDDSKVNCEAKILTRGTKQ